MDFKMPPNWRAKHHITLGQQKTYSRFPVSESSVEYSVITSLLDCVHVTSVEQVMNPSLWVKFEQRRKEMLKSKSIDAEELAAIGLNEIEVREVLAYTKNFTPHIELAHVPYDLNMALLFHCTGSEKNVESILSEGLDERLGNSSGLLGRGIYFADNPMKSISYDRCGVIFIFAVLLGDCLMLDDEQKTNFVREPKKLDDQKRHLNDLFFDSIAGRPYGKDNEFVIYNRYQCIPLYKVTYEKSSRSSGNSRTEFDSGEYVRARKDFPELCWKKDAKYEHPMPSHIRLKNSAGWPFCAEKFFEKMGV